MNLDIESAKRRVSLDLAPKDTPSLGSIEDAFRGIHDKPPRWTIVGFVICIALILAYINMSDRVSFEISVVAYTLLGSFAIVFLATGILQARCSMMKNGNVPYFFIYSNGFIYELRNSEGKSIERQTVCFDDVDSLDFYFVNTSKDSLHKDLMVYAPKAKLIYTLKGTDLDTFKNVASVAIEKSWLACSYKRAMDEFYRTGYVTFANIRIGRGHFYVDDIDWFEGSAHYRIGTGMVTIYPADPQSSPYYNAIKNPTGAWAIDISKVNNKRLFMELFNEFFGDHLLN